MRTRLALGFAAALAASTFLFAAPKHFGGTYVDLNDPNLPTDYKYQGEYAGDGLGAQVIALDKGAFQAVLYPGGLPGAGYRDLFGGGLAQVVGHSFEVVDAFAYNSIGEAQGMLKYLFTRGQAHAGMHGDRTEFADVNYNRGSMRIDSVANLEKTALDANRLHCPCAHF